MIGSEPISSIIGFVQHSRPEAEEGARRMVKDFPAQLDSRSPAVLELLIEVWNRGQDECDETAGLEGIHVWKETDAGHFEAREPLQVKGYQVAHTWQCRR